MTQVVLWYQKAAEQGHTDAQYNLGAMYYAGDGIPKDFKKAAEQRYALAQYNLALIYKNGEGVAKIRLRLLIR